MYYSAIIACISTTLLVVLVHGQDSTATSNRCDPGTYPTEMVSSADGQLTMFCNPAPKCAALNQGTATCTDQWTNSCGATTYIGAIRFQGPDENGTPMYSVQCCQHAGITSANVVRVSNRILNTDDSFVDEVDGNLLQLVNNIFDVQNQKHIIQRIQVRCS